MNRTLLKLLADRCNLGLGSLALVEKQLLEISTVVDNLLENFHADSGFFITPPLTVYEED